MARDEDVSGRFLSQSAAPGKGRRTNKEAAVNNPQEWIATLRTEHTVVDAEHWKRKGKNP